MDSVSDAHFSQGLVLRTQFLPHFSQPEVHRVVDDFNGSSLHDTGCDRRVAEIPARLHEAHIVETNGPRVNEARLYKSFLQLASRSKLGLLLRRRATASSARAKQSHRASDRTAGLEVKRCRLHYLFEHFVT